MQAIASELYVIHVAIYSLLYTVGMDDIQGLPTTHRNQRGSKE